MKIKPEPGIQSLEIRDMPYPELKPESVIIRVKAAGICGSDVHTLLSEWPIARKRSPVLGHEFSGEIVELGDKVEGFVEGDRVTANPKFYCGKCYYCLNDQRALCSKIPFFYGAMAEYVSLPEYSLFKLPSKVSYDEGALIEPFTIALYGVYDLSSLKAGKSVVIIGPGAIGLSTLLASKLLNPGLIVVTGTREDLSPRLQMAKKLGADRVINVSEEDPVKTVIDLTEGLGADHLYECAGAGLIGQGISMLKGGGEFIAIGHPSEGRIIRLNPAEYFKLQINRIRIQGSILYDSKTWTRSIELLKNSKINLKPLITHRIPLKEAASGFELARKKEAIKVIIHP